MRALLAILISTVSFSAFATTLTQYRCRTMLEEPGDPTPVQRFELRRATNGTYSAWATRNDAQTPIARIARNLDCDFTYAPVCNIQTGLCANIPPEVLNPGEYTGTLFRCTVRNETFTNEILERITFVEGKGYLSSHAVQVFHFPQADIFHFDFGPGCVAVVR